MNKERSDRTIGIKEIEDRIEFAFRYPKMAAKEIKTQLNKGGKYPDWVWHYVYRLRKKQLGKPNPKLIRGILIGLLRKNRVENAPFSEISEYIGEVIKFLFPEDFIFERDKFLKEFYYDSDDWLFDQVSDSAIDQADKEFIAESLDLLGLKYKEYNGLLYVVLDKRQAMSLISQKGSEDHIYVLEMVRNVDAWKYDKEKMLAKLDYAKAS